MSNSEEIDLIIEKIYKIQTNADRKFWKEGLFPNYRLNKILNYKRPDNSIFFYRFNCVCFKKYLE